MTFLLKALFDFGERIRKRQRILINMYLMIGKCECELQLILTVQWRVRPSLESGCQSAAV